jgi:2-polyprenyl-6-methoxyphenol hydroxylase-like FAD-dependent oxidoreductase
LLMVGSMSLSSLREAVRSGTMTRDKSVLIVGAGPAGLTLAYGLALRGVSFQVIDPLPEPVRDSRAHGFAGHTLQALDHLELAEPMLAAAKQPPPILREYFGDRLVTEVDNGTLPRDPYPTMLPIFQQRVVRVLEEALLDRGHEIEWLTRLVRVDVDDDGVIADVDRNGTRDKIRADWVIGSDGTRSTVRRSLGLEVPPEPSDHRILICECDLDWKRSRDIWWTFHAPDGVAGAIFNDFTEKWHVLITQVGGGGAADFELMGDILRRRSRDPHLQLSNPSWVGAVSLTQQISSAFVKGRGILAGDAAHVFSTTAGHGLHAAIEDALNLEWKLGLTLSGAAAPSLLRSYEIERHRHAEDVVRLTRHGLNFLTMEGLRGRVAWSLAFFVGRYLRAISTIVKKQITKLESHYDTSPLTLHDTKHGTPRTRAGWLVPDAVCRVGGRPAHLLEIFRGTHATILLFAGTAPTPSKLLELEKLEESVAPLGDHVRVHYVFPSEQYALDAGFGSDDPRVIVDGLERIRVVFGVDAPEVMYVRPDSYIGLRTEHLEPHRLAGYLQKIYAPDLTAKQQVLA